ncbi:GAF domain-containing protein [Candidatus Desantisbacteria bacterium]|nr:GAF domain-containing protein [Candidatus Desantisbacteria bacterium]
MEKNTINKNLSRQVRDMELLTLIGIALSSELKIGKLLQMIADVCRKLCKAEASALLMLENNSGKLTYKFAAISGVNKKDVKEKPKGIGIYKLVIESKHPICIKDITKEPNSSGVPKGHIKVKSFLGVPLITHKNKIEGMLILTHSKPDMFGKYETELVTILANQAAVALENAKLNSKLEKSLKNLENANKELQSLDKLKSDFLANISHELRTPLTSIKGYTELLLGKKAGPLNNNQENELRVVLRNTERLIVLINNLLSSIKFEQADHVLFFSEINPEVIINNCIKEISPLLKTKGLKLNFQNKLKKPVKILGDVEKLHVVIINLLGNAIKFTEYGKIILKIEVIKGKKIKFINCPNKDKCDIKPDKKYLKISISDTGIGISKETICKLFDRFYQVDSSSTRKFEGTGLGLSIVKEILNLHNSPIEILSKIGKGTTFSFVLPIITKI